MSQLLFLQVIIAMVMHPDFCGHNVANHLRTMFLRLLRSILYRIISMTFIYYITQIIDFQIFREFRLSSTSPPMFLNMLSSSFKSYRV